MNFCGFLCRTSTLGKWFVSTLRVGERETERKIGLPIQNVTCQRKFKFGRIGFPPLPPQNAVTLELLPPGQLKREFLRPTVSFLSRPLGPQELHNASSALFSVVALTNTIVLVFPLLTLLLTNENEYMQTVANRMKFRLFHSISISIFRIDSTG